MVDTQTPLVDQPLYATDPHNPNVVTINGTVYTILDNGYIFGVGTSACLILSDDSIFVTPIPSGLLVCPACFHPEGTTVVPDWEICGIPVGIYGLLIKLKQPWICHCLKAIQYVSINMIPIDPTLSFAPACGSSQVPPVGLSAGLAVAAIGAGLLGLGALGALASLQKFTTYTTTLPPGFDPEKFADITCPEDAAGLAERPTASDSTDVCDSVFRQLNDIEIACAEDPAGLAIRPKAGSEENKDCNP